MTVAMGATLQCTFAVPPGISTLVVTPKGPPVMMGGPLAATIMDFVPITNIPPFGMCIAPTNPAFISATSAAAGVPTPVPCLPIITSPWAPGAPTVMVNNLPGLNAMSKCMCTWLGVISVVAPGQFMVQGP